mmetsp:Transcript_3465/g.6575  ORF Transcript_3465/g.6575 Transcript_3465/m.6575 type:complete len:241 (+) Transcript_3465:172-894(+)
MVWSMQNFVDSNGGGQFGKWFVYLTHWGVLLELTYLGFRAFTTWKSQLETPEQGPEFPWFVKATWLLRNITLPATFTIFLLYWVMVFEPSRGVKAISVVTHGANFLVMVVDAALVSSPFLLVHTLHFWLFGATYVLFTLVYYGAGGTNPSGGGYIYSALDWGGSPSRAAIVSIAILLVLIPLLCFLFYLLVDAVNRFDVVCCGGSISRSVAPGSVGPVEFAAVAGDEHGGDEDGDNGTEV